MPKLVIRAGLIACGLALFVACGAKPAQAEKIVDSSGPYRLGATQSGSQNFPSVTPFGGNGSIGAWVSPGGSASHPFIGYYSIFGDPRGTPIQLGSSSGLTAGAAAVSTAAVSFSDASALIFFSAVPRSGGAQDIFAQRMSAFRVKVGAPLRINQTLAGVQTQLFAVPLSNGNVLATWQSRGSTAASSYDLRGRVVSKAGGGTQKDVAVTVNTAGAQTQTALAALTNGNSVIAYFVRTGSGASVKQAAYLQRLSPTGARLGAPKLIKQTTGPNTYGGVGVAALPSGRYIALWWAAASGGQAVLKRQIFAASGTAGGAVALGTAPVRPTSQNAPKAQLGTEGVVVAFETFAAGKYAVNALALNTSGALIAAAKQLGSDAKPVASTSLSYDPTSKIYYVSWTDTLSASSVRSFADSFYVTKGCSVKC